VSITKYIHILSYEIILTKNIYSNLIKIKGLGKLTINKILSRSNIHKFLVHKYIFGRRNWLINLNFRYYLLNLNTFSNFQLIYINWLITMNLLRGNRYLLGLPVRNQRTRTNAKNSRILNGSTKIKKVL